MFVIKLTFIFFSLRFYSGCDSQTKRETEVHGGKNITRRDDPQARFVMLDLDFKFKGIGQMCFIH